MQTTDCPTNSPESFPEAWLQLLGGSAAVDLSPLVRVRERRAAGQVIYPPEGEMFTALRLTPPARVRAVILGQDPYHGEGEAFGLAFAVKRATKLPPSLRNIVKEYSTDLGLPAPAWPDLRAWARNGVLLLNTILSVVKDKPKSHQSLGWQQLTDRIIAACSEAPQPVAFLLWGEPAKEKRHLIDERRNVVVVSAHPSPLSAYRGFLGSRPFSTANRLLREMGEAPIDWRLPEEDLPLFGGL